MTISSNSIFPVSCFSWVINMSGGWNRHGRITLLVMQQSRQQNVTPPSNHVVKSAPPKPQSPPQHPPPPPSPPLPFKSKGSSSEPPSRACETWKKHIWTPELLPKLKYFLWRVASNALPTGANLQTRCILNNTNCARCGERETIDHLLFNCNFAREVWRCGPWSDTRHTSDVSSFKPMIESSGTWQNLPPNGLIFDNRAPTPHDTAIKAISSQREWELAQTNGPIKTPPLLPRPPLRQDDATIFCNTDAAWRANRQLAGLGWILTDRDSTELHRASKPASNVSSACMAEALAIREALLHASSLQHTNICIRTDSQVLVRAITTRRRSTELYGILSDIDSLAFFPSSPFVSCVFIFTPRASNGPADSLAKSCLFSHLGLRP
ncbi:uncharacterized protein LOC108825204 [Raphanus sativus]|uniref:Uncharacterized protein LOC108825204 n=1 Tax=Raphanus sativus TaxID=3726 RepID=A0A6J0L336_RAPSA|nr:uncharacterized protein LOC108825204 [Raphanus sativus]